MAAAVATIDLGYGVVGLAGFGSLLNAGSIRVWLGLLSAGILVAIGMKTLWQGIRARSALESADEVVGPTRAFPTAVAATVFNPLTIALWTVSFPAAAPARATTSTAAAAGLVRRRIGRRLLPAIDVTTGLGLIAFGGLPGYRTLHER